MMLRRIKKQRRIALGKIDPQAIKSLRDKTGAGIMDAKSALVDAKGDSKKAIEILRQKGQAKAVKKADRIAKNGLIEAYVHTGKIGVMIELNCETDFVARTDEFKELAHDLAMHIAASNPRYLTKDDLSKDEIDKEKKVIIKQLEQQKAPSLHQAKIIEGKLDKFYQEVCLYSQPFIKDPSLSVEKVIVDKIAKFGENIVVGRFDRFELGEL
jgi:elongation factor Ts